VKKSSKLRSLFFTEILTIFRQINVFTKEVPKELISRKSFQRDRVFLKNELFHTVIQSLKRGKLEIFTTYY